MSLWFERQHQASWIAASLLAATTLIGSETKLISDDDPARDVIEKILKENKSAIVSAPVSAQQEVPPTPKPLAPQPKQLVPKKSDAGTATQIPTAKDPTTTPSPKVALEKPASKAAPKTSAADPIVAVSANPTAKTQAVNNTAPQNPGTTTAQQTPPPRPTPPKGSVLTDAPAPPVAVMPTTDSAIGQDVIPAPAAAPGKVAAPPATPRDPVDAIVNDLINPKTKPVGAPDSDLAVAERHRDAMVLFQQAKQAESTGKIQDALRIANNAKRYYPEHPEINAMVTRLQNEIKNNRFANSGTNLAKARLAAGLTRGQVLISERRWDEAADILHGVVEAAKLFPDTAKVDLYARLAEKELAHPNLRGRTGRSVLDSLDQSAAAEQSNQMKLVAAAIAAPENANRLLRAAESQVPTWYALAKIRLTTPMNVDFKSRSVNEILEEIGRTTDVKFVLDTPVIASGSHLNTFINLRASDLPAETLLNIICQRAGVEYVIMERSIIITTADRAVQYVRRMGDAIRNNWAMGRMLFPEMNPELYATPPRSELIMSSSAASRSGRPEQVAPYLISRDALITEIKAQLR